MNDTDETREAVVRKISAEIVHGKKYRRQGFNHKTTDFSAALYDAYDAALAARPDTVGDEKRCWQCGGEVGKVNARQGSQYLCETCKDAMPPEMWFRKSVIEIPITGNPPAYQPVGDVEAARAFLIAKAMERYDCNPYRDNADIFEDVASFAASQPSSPPSGWVAIASADDLPKEDGRYLITFRWDDEGPELYVALDTFRLGGDGGPWWEAEISAPLSTRQLIAWMPLPKPYQVGQAPSTDGL